MDPTAAVLFLLGVVAFEAALMVGAHYIWKLALWKNERNIRFREERERNAA